MSIAWKVLTAPQLEELLAHGSFAGAPVDLADGYIHLSTAEQLPETLAKHFAGQSDLHVVAVDLAVLGDAVCWEPSRGGQLFPHLYGMLSVAAVKAHGPLTYAVDRRPVLPSPSGEGLGVGSLRMARAMGIGPTRTPPLKGRG